MWSAAAVDAPAASIHPSNAATIAGDPAKGRSVRPDLQRRGARLRRRGVRRRPAPLAGVVAVRAHAHPRVCAAAEGDQEQEEAPLARLLLHLDVLEHVEPALEQVEHLLVLGPGLGDLVTKDVVLAAEPLGFLVRALQPLLEGAVLQLMAHDLCAIAGAPADPFHGGAHAHTGLLPK